MGTLLTWTGLTLIVGLNPALELFGLHASGILVPIGGILMVLGTVLLWLGRNRREVL